MTFDRERKDEIVSDTTKLLKYGYPDWMIPGASFRFKESEYHTYEIRGLVDKVIVFRAWRKKAWEYNFLTVEDCDQIENLDDAI